MNKVKRTILLLIVWMVLGMLTGCTALEEEVMEVVSEMTGEIAPLPDFVPKPEKMITQIDLPKCYYYIEENRHSSVIRKGQILVGRLHPYLR